MRTAKIITASTFALILLSNFVMAAYNATYTKTDARIVMFDFIYGAMGWVIGIFAFLLLLVGIFLVINHWVKRKLGKE